MEPSRQPAAELGRHQAGEVLAQLLAEPFLRGRVGQVHPPSTVGLNWRYK
jgi:hypothetical protein